jgi:hypothetical protein
MECMTSFGALEGIYLPRLMIGMVDVGIGEACISPFNCIVCSVLKLMYNLVISSRERFFHVLSIVCVCVCSIVEV